MAKTAFVTGSNGFVGVNLVEELLSQNWRVVAMHRVGADIHQLSVLPAERVIGDGSDYRSLRAAMPANVDTVFHVAGSTSLWARLRIEQMRVNVKGTRNVVRAALESGAGCLVHTSSAVAYGLHGGTVTEDTPSRGTSAAINYVRSKALAEREVRRGISRGLKAVIMNPAHIIGPYDDGNWSRLFRMVEHGRLPAVPGGGGSFCHVKSVARAHIVAAERGRSGANYLLGGADTSYLGLVRAIARLRGKRRRFLPLPSSALKLYARAEELIAVVFRREPDITRDGVELLSVNLYCKNQRAVDELGYEPLPLSRLLEDCHRWLVESGRLRALGK